MRQSKPDPVSVPEFEPDQPWPEGSVDPHVPNAQPSAVLILMCVRRLWRELRTYVPALAPCSW